MPLAPAIFQQAIDVAADLRVTVIGDKIFPAIITNDKLNPDSSIRDWRIGYDEGEMRVKELGLAYGAIDLVLSKKGEIWFLENNSNGQWAFVEEKTGQPMGKALADLLQGRATWI